MGNAFTGRPPPSTPAPSRVFSARGVTRATPSSGRPRGRGRARRLKTAWLSLRIRSLKTRWRPGGAKKWAGWLRQHGCSDFLLIIVIGSVIFTFFSPWWFSEIASNWGSIDVTVLITFWVCGVVFVGVGLFMAYSIWKFRHREGVKAEYEPENARLEWTLTIITTVGVVAMLAPGLIVWDEYVNPPDDAQEFEVMSMQWTWKFRFPGADGKLGTVDVGNIGADTPSA